MNYISFIAIASAVGGLFYYAYFRDRQTASRMLQPAAQYQLNPIPQLRDLFSQSSRRPASIEPARPRNIKESAPLSGVCASCSKNIALPFRCRYCGELFCGDHRMPEDHHCDTF
ncbi:MAG: AN1-type zinc finger protein [archaeon]